MTTSLQDQRAHRQMLAAVADGALSARQAGVVGSAITAERHVQQTTTLRRSEGTTWAPPGTTKGWSRDHRLIAMWHRAKDRTQRRALLLLAAIDAKAAYPELARLESLMVEADRLADRL